ncbi:hypothetical protein BJ508DRAFT_367212 [Ascobolus immersus RN42]|uniref:RING-type domain-containing protein n=1 Tax=Ascobolus immersus RN42 TaxID=1160509 RepID=A0A3N4HKW2_ASCIM|nr:hypothetical protein BJ508DRAFT_367212 [Ascobolus immersus RN42]
MTKVKTGSKQAGKRSSVEGRWTLEVSKNQDVTTMVWDTALQITKTTVIIPQISADDPTEREKLSTTDRFDVVPGDPYTLTLSTQLRTLKRYDQSTDKHLSALLYVPALDDSLSSSDCLRLGRLPPNSSSITHDTHGYRIDAIALFPFVSAECTEKFLRSTKEDGMSTVAALMYPLLDGQVIDNQEIDDDVPGFRMAYGEYNVGVYAVNASIGMGLMEEVIRFSKPIGQIKGLEGVGGKEEDYLGVNLAIALQTKNPIPGLWIFILIVLAILLMIVGSVSLVMHILQYRRRQEVIRALLEGDAGSSSYPAGISLPKEVLKLFPITSYAEVAQEQETTAELAPLPSGSTDDGSSREASLDLSNRRSPPPRITTSTGPVQYAPPSPPLPPTPTTLPAKPHFSQTHHLRSASSTTTSSASSSSSLSHHHHIPPKPPLPPGPQNPHQPSCAICLDDFTALTLIRLLPCRHYFHPPCIDNFLLNSSCVCPVCKHNLLPSDYVSKLKQRGMVEELRAVVTEAANNRGGGHNGRWTEGRVVQALFPGLGRGGGGFGRRREGGLEGGIGMLEQGRAGAEGGEEGSGWRWRLRKVVRGSGPMS